MSEPKLFRHEPLWFRLCFLANWLTVILCCLTFVGSLLAVLLGYDFLVAARASAMGGIISGIALLLLLRR